MPPGWAGKHLSLLGIREDFADIVPTAVVPTAASPAIVAPTKVAPGEVIMEAYERRLKAHIREQVVPLRKRLLGLEETLEERTASLERTIEERSNRIHRLKRAWTSATENSRHSKLQGGDAGSGAGWTSLLK